METLSSDTLQEVITNRSFFFKYDSDRKTKNLKIYDFNAPGNPHRHPNVILPHEKVDIQKYVDAATLTPAKLEEVYAYYSLLIDMHIAAVRPSGLDTKSYVPPHLIPFSPRRVPDMNLNNKFFEYYHRLREPNKSLLEYMELMKREQEALPTTHHYDHDKGSKYDVEWTDDQKYPHVASRLGFPALYESPIERILGLERAPAHPGYQLQPFVQTPSYDPDADLCFEEGETIYENKRVAEWIKFWKASTVTILAGYPVFYGYEIYCGNGPPSLQWLAENANWFTMLQFQDASGQNTTKMRYPDDHNFMSWHYDLKRTMLRPTFTFHLAVVLSWVYHIDLDYVTSMKYNKDKDLVFVKKPNRLWGEYETVHEVHHLEQMVPAPVTALKHMSSMDPNGILKVHDMADRSYFKFYKEDKYWNQELKDEFISETRGLWETTHADKRLGRIFNSRGQVDDQFQLDMLKVDREMAEAVKKHGSINIPTSHVEDFYQKIEEQRSAIYQKATA
jgi:hypothetical protein